MASRAFTLKELAIVLAVIAVLASLMVITATENRRRARAAKDEAQVQAIQTATRTWAQGNN